MQQRLQLEIRSELKLSRVCGLCGQEISSKRQLPLNAIVIEGYGMCPNCCQRVRREIEDAYAYRAKWLRRVKAITKQKGWDWEYEPGRGFQRVNRSALLPPTSPKIPVVPPDNHNK